MTASVLLACSGGKSQAAPEGGTPPSGISYYVDSLPSDGCLPRDLGSALQNCSIVEVHFTSQACSCSNPGRSSLTADMVKVVEDYLRGRDCGGSGQPPCSEACACTLDPVATAVLLDACLQQQAVPSDAVGWCYIDANQDAGSASLIPLCSGGRGVRFLGPSVPVAGALLKLACGSR
jgi:hypothetical protein